MIFLIKIRNIIQQDMKILFQLLLMMRKTRLHLEAKIMQSKVSYLLGYVYVKKAFAQPREGPSLQ